MSALSTQLGQLEVIQLENQTMCDQIRWQGSQLESGQREITTPRMFRFCCADLDQLQQLKESYEQTIEELRSSQLNQDQYNALKDQLAAEVHNRVLYESTMIYICSTSTPSSSRED